VNILRVAASLPANLTCGTSVSEAVTAVAGDDGTEAALEIGQAPIPGAGAPMTLGEPGGDTTPDPGGETEVSIPLTGAAAAQTGRRSVIIALAGPDRELKDGFFRLPLSSQSESLLFLRVRFPGSLPDDAFFLAFATSDVGVVGEYVFLALVPPGTSGCGDGEVGTGETCDPPGSVIPGTKFVCRDDCGYCGDRFVNGPEDCETSEDCSSPGEVCTSSCTCEFFG
jgi:hypothetical protein